MRAVKTKLKSREGASITFALLIFLVCAVVSSSVIVAASTAGGRLSTVKEMDQRYYAATAAAERLRDVLDEKTAIVTYRKNGEDKSVISTSATGFLGEASKAVVDRSTPSLSVNVPTPAGAEGYSCSVSGVLNQGLLTFDIAVTGGTINKNGTYKLQMVFASTVMDAEDRTPAGAATPGTGRAKVTWRLSSIKKFKA